MIDGKLTEQSKFLTGASKMTQRFSVGSFIFKDMASTSSSSQVLSVKGTEPCTDKWKISVALNLHFFQQLYMHCEMSLRDPTPTLSAKACNYDAATRK